MTLTSTTTDRETIRDYLDGVADANALPEPQWGPIGKDVFARTYARSVDVRTETGEMLGTRIESWAETVKRVVNGSLSYVSRDHWTGDEDIRLFDLIYNFRAIPAGRHLWVTGTESSTFSKNCWATGWGVRTSSHFAFLASRLLEGGGVGSNYSADLLHVTQPITGSVNLLFALDESHPDFDRVAVAAGDRLNVHVPAGAGRIVVDDSREGWVETWTRVIDLATDLRGKTTMVIDLNAVRPYGALLKTFGGTASGPDALVRSLIGITDVTNTVAASTLLGRRLTGLEAMEIDHALASAVVAGGSRRSARMALMSWKDSDIFEFIHAKEDHQSHWTTNISVEIDDDFHVALFSVEHPLHERAESVLREVVTGMVRNGEPGMVDTSAMSRDEPAPIRITNPCLRGDTRMLTKDGLVPIRDLAGLSFEIWNGKSWSRSTAWSTGVKEVFEVRLSNGTTIAATANHVFATATGEEVPVAQLLGKKLRLLLGAEWEGSDPYNHDEALLLGFLQGDGSKRLDCAGLSVRNNEPEMVALLTTFGFRLEPSGAWYAGVDTQAAALVAKAETLDEHLPERRLPAWLFTARPQTVKAFLRGLYSANGAAIRDHRRVTLKSTCRDLVGQVQQLLSAIGISSYITTNPPSAIAWSNGEYTSKESYDLNIGNMDGLEVFSTEIGFLHEHKTSNLNAYDRTKRSRPRDFTVVGVNSVGYEEVFDFNEPQRHWGWANGLQVHNCGEAQLSSYDIDGLIAGESCNLGSVDLDAFGTDLDGATEAFELMARFLYRATLNPHLDPLASAIENTNRRIGVGIMGLQGWCASFGVKLSELETSDELRGALTRFRQVVRASADSLADNLGTPRSVKVTAVAPTGTIAQLRGSQPGIHSVFARHFIRRVRYAHADLGLAALVEAGHKVTDDIYAANTSVVEFIVRDSILDRHDASLIEQSDEIPAEAFFGIIATVQATFCGEGDGQSVSATAQIPRDTSPVDLERAIRSRLGSMKGFTVFPEVSRPLAPYEAISAEQFESARAAGLAQTSGDSNSGECVGGSCPVR